MVSGAVRPAQVAVRGRGKPLDKIGIYADCYFKKHKHMPVFSKRFVPTVKTNNPLF